MPRRVSININNGRVMTMEQSFHDGPIVVITGPNARLSITPGDMVTMINWYRYQKDRGNDNLRFGDEPIPVLTQEELNAFNWAMRQNYTSVAASYARILAGALARITSVERERIE